ncbi:MAG: hypothetical protein ACI819_000993 [Neolewinella sp.]
MTAGEAKNVDNAVVLARLFNEASGQKAPSKKHGLFISRALASLLKSLLRYVVTTAKLRFQRLTTPQKTGDLVYQT